MERKLSVFILAAALFALGGCVKETYDIEKVSKKAHLAPGFGVSVAKGKITLADIIEMHDTIVSDNDTIFIYGDNVVRFVFRKDSIINFRLEDYYDLDDMVSYSDSFKVGELDLGSFEDSIAFSLDEISMAFPTIVRAALVALDGTTGDFPPFPAVSLDEKTYGPFDNFEYATFSEGTIEITVTNNLTIPVTGLNIQLYNAAGPTPIGDAFTFTSINPGQTRSDSIDLENMIISNSIIAAVSLGNNPGADDVPIDLDNNNIGINIAGRNLKIKSGRIVLPVQDIFSIGKKDTVSVDPGSDIKIDFIKIKTGNLTYNIDALVPIAASLSITLPTSLRDNDTIKETITVNPNSVISGNISLNNATVDLGTIINKPYNMLPVNYSVEVSSNGEMVDFNSTDEVSLEIELLNPEIDYVKGYFGQYGDTINSDTLDLEIKDILDHVTGSYFISKPSLKLNYSNSFAIPVKIDLDVAGYKGSDSVNLDLDPEILKYPAAPAVSDISDVFEINTDNSQLPELISMPPEKIRFAGSAVMNPEDTSSLDNYIFGNSRFLADLEVEVPLEFRLKSLQFADTVNNFMQDEDQNNDSPVNPEDFKSVKILLTAENGFPLGVSINMSLYNSATNDTICPLEASGLLEPASINASGIVTEAAQSTTEIELTSDFWNSINVADKIIFSFTLNTTNSQLNQDVKIYSDYYIDYKAALFLKADINFDLE